MDVQYIMYVHKYVCTFVHIYNVHTYIYNGTYLSMYIHIYVHMHLYVEMSLFAHKNMYCAQT